MPLWSWRIPFIMGGIFGLFIFIMRRNLFESSKYHNDNVVKTDITIPIIKVFKNNFQNFTHKYFQKQRKSNFLKIHKNIKLKERTQRLLEDYCPLPPSQVVLKK